MADFQRPAFIGDEAWAAASESQRKDWSYYARSLAELAEDAKFRAVVMRWLDDVLGVDGATIDPAECGQVGHQSLMLLREGARQGGIQIRGHFMAVAPRMWMRAMQETKNARTRVDPEE